MAGNIGSIRADLRLLRKWKPRRCEWRRGRKQSIKIGSFTQTRKKATKLYLHAVDGDRVAFHFSADGHLFSVICLRFDLVLVRDFVHRSVLGNQN